MRYVDLRGNIYRDAPYKGYYGVRPAFYLDAEYYTVLQGKGTESDPYVGTVNNKPQEVLSISGPEKNTGDGDWDVDTDKNIQLKLGELYSKDGKYANPTIPVYVIQKPRSDKENMVILFLAEGYTKSQQSKFIKDVQQMWKKTLETEPYRSMANRFNVYALCTASIDTYGSYEGNSTFFSVVDSSRNTHIATTLNGQWKNHLPERAIGPAFIEKIHDAHIPETTDPNEFRIGNEYEPYYYVYNYIDQFVVLVNSGKYFGASHDSIKSGIHYIVTSSDHYYSPFIMRHELGHGLLHLGDEYEITYAPVSEESMKASLNLSHTKDPKLVKWKNMLGFRHTYSCPHTDSSYIYNSSSMCIMRSNTNNELCDVCRLQGFKRMSQLIKNPPSLYVAEPEVKRYTGDYKNPNENSSAFEAANFLGYYNYDADRSSRLLSGFSKNQFNPGLKGSEIELRTIVQNLSDTEEKTVTLRIWVEHYDGTIATATDGKKILTEKKFKIPVWSDKSKFWTKNALEYNGSDFDSGLVNCSLVYRIPENAVLQNSDTVGFEVVDDATGLTLADDDTETGTYADVTIEYKLEDGSDVPNTKPAVLPVATGTKVDWEFPEELNGYTLVKSENADKTVGTGGLKITCWYKAKEDKPSAPFVITDESGAAADKTLKAGKFRARFILPEGQKTAAVIIAKYVNGSLGELKMSGLKEVQNIIETDFITITGEDLTKETEIKAFAFESMGNIKPIYDFQHIAK